MEPTITLSYLTINSEVILKLICTELLMMSKMREIQNIAFIYDGHMLYHEAVEGANLGDIKNCVHLIRIEEDVDLHKLEQILPAKYDKWSLSFYYRRVFDIFPELEDKLQDAVTDLCNGAPEEEDLNDYLHEAYYDEY